jgi:hypothetical protein
MAYYLNKQNDMVCNLMKENIVSWDMNETLDSLFPTQMLIWQSKNSAINLFIESGLSSYDNGYQKPKY